MASSDDQLLTAALAAKGLQTAQHALAEAQRALARAEPVPLDVAALIASIVQAVSRIKLPRPDVSVDATQNIPAPVINMEAAAAPNVTVNPSIHVDVPKADTPIINVAAPVVNFEQQPIINVAAPSVRVHEVPAKPWRMTVYRNERTQLIEYADLVPVE